MSILKYYISTEYPVELSNELKEHVSIYSKRKSNNKLIILKELDYININIRNLLKNDFVYEVEFIVDNTEYEYLINASDGTVVKKNLEVVSLDEVQNGQMASTSEVQQPVKLTKDENTSKVEQNNTDNIITKRCRTILYSSTR